MPDQQKPIDHIRRADGFEPLLACRKRPPMVWRVVRACQAQGGLRAIGLLLRHVVPLSACHNDAGLLGVADAPETAAVWLVLALVPDGAPIRRWLRTASHLARPGEPYAQMWHCRSVAVLACGRCPTAGGSRGSTVSSASFSSRSLTSACSPRNLPGGCAGRVGRTPSPVPSSCGGPAWCGIGRGARSATGQGSGPFVMRLDCCGSLRRISGKLPAQVSNPSGRSTRSR